MKDLNSLSKEELIRLLNQKEEEPKAAEALSSTTNLTVESQQKISSIVRATAPNADQVKQTH